MKKRDQPETRSAIEVARITARQVILVTIITAAAGIVGAIIQGVFTSHKNESLATQLSSSNMKAKGLDQSLKESEAEREALYRLTANYLESDLYSTSTKGGDADKSSDSSGLSETELAYRRLRRAVFLNMSVLRANATIVEKTLDTLAQRGHKWVAPQKAGILADLPDLKTTRLRWLEDTAIPQLQQSIDAFVRRPAQGIPTARVYLPEAIQIFTRSPDDRLAVTVESMEALKDEAALLKRSLSAG